MPVMEGLAGPISQIIFPQMILRRTSGASLVMSTFTYRDFDQSINRSTESIKERTDPVFSTEKNAWMSVTNPSGDVASLLTDDYWFYIVD